MSTRLFVCLLAGALMTPQAVFGESPAAAGFRLAPIPHAETIPWLTGSTEATWQKTPPYLEVLLAAEPIARSPSLFAAAPAPDRGLLSKQSSLSGRTAPGK